MDGYFIDGEPVFDETAVGWGHGVGGKGQNNATTFQALGARREKRNPTPYDSPRFAFLSDS